MHELSIAISLVDLACEQARGLHHERVAALHVRVGLLSGVVADALRQAFTMASAGTAIDGARLDVEEIPVTVWCPRCSAERQLPAVQRRRCPVCDEVAHEVRRGEELELVTLEIVADAADR